MVSDHARDLDEALAEDGQDISLVRPASPPRPRVAVTCRAFVRVTAAPELVDGVSQDASDVTISPTEIIAAGWPGESNASAGIDIRVPVKTDKAVIAGRTRQIEAVFPIYVAGELVRIDFRVTG